MRTATNRTALFLLASSLVSLSTPAFAAVTDNHLSSVSQVANATANGTESSEQALAKAVDLAENGKIKQAFTIAKEAKDRPVDDRFFSVNYVNTLLTIADQEGNKLENKILNEAINEVNQVQATKSADGKQDPEIAYHFMVATGRLADALLPKNEDIASKLMLQEGSIAGNLKTNPLYPQDSLASLSEPMFKKAQALAIQGDEAKALDSLNEAFRLGYVKFEEVESDEHLSKLKSRGRLMEVTSLAKVAYLEKTKRWSEKALRDFRRFRYRLDVMDEEGDRMTEDEFAGKILVVDLWATWCPPCREGIPHFIELQKNFQDLGVEVVGVSMDNPEDPASSLSTVQKFITEQDVNYSWAMGDKSVTDKIPGDQLLPTTLFIDRSGSVRYVAEGYHNYMQLEAITQALASESEAVSINAAH